MRSAPGNKNADHKDRRFRRLSCLRLAWRAACRSDAGQAKAQQQHAGWLRDIVRRGGIGEGEAQVIEIERTVVQVFEAYQCRVGKPVALDPRVYGAVRIAASLASKVIRVGVVDVQAEHKFTTHGKAAQVQSGSDQGAMVVKQEDVVPRNAVIGDEIKVVAVRRGSAFVTGDDVGGAAGQHRIALGAGDGDWEGEGGQWGDQCNGSQELANRFHIESQELKKDSTGVAQIMP